MNASLNTVFDMSITSGGLCLRGMQIQVNVLNSECGLVVHIYSTCFASVTGLFERCIHPLLGFSVPKSSCSLSQP